MTQEEKARAYDEALERARKQRADYQKELDKTDKNSQLAGLLRAGISAIDMTFPELAESEDERIRKKLYEFISDTLGDELDGYDISKGEALAYLEKQKEQKPAEWKPTEEQFNYLAKAIMTLGEEGDCKTTEVLSEIKNGLKDSFPDWKMSPDYPKEGCNVSLNGEIKKIQEWSEEDEKQIRQIERIVKDAGGSVKLQEQIHNWFKSLLPTLKDREMKLKILKYLSTRCSSLEFEEVEDYLNNLRPSWKPSEEQMKALQNAVALTACDKELARLYNQLKKL